MILTMMCILAAMPPEKSMKEQATDLIKSQKVGVLATSYDDVPFGSLVPFALDEKGNLLIYISDMAVHTQNLKKAKPVNGTFTKCSFTIFKTDKKDIFNSSRATIIAEATKVDAKDVEELYFKKFPKAKRFNKLHDFSFYRLEVKKIHFVGGFGNIGWVE